MLREPVARAISFFQYQKTRLRIPPELSIEDYLAHADTLTDLDFLDPANERYFAVGGGRYADFLPAWLERFGPDRLLVLDFEELTADPARVLRDTATWLGLDPLLLPDGRARRRRTGRWRSRAGGSNGSRSRVNDRFERLLRRYPGVKRRMRALYFRLNGQPAGEPHQRRRPRATSPSASGSRTSGSRLSSRSAGLLAAVLAGGGGRAERRHSLTPREPHDPDVDRGADDADADEQRDRRHPAIGPSASEESPTRPSPSTADVTSASGSARREQRLRGAAGAGRTPRISAPSRYARLCPNPSASTRPRAVGRRSCRSP